MTPLYDVFCFIIPLLSIVDALDARRWSRQYKLLVESTLHKLNTTDTRFASMFPLLQELCCKGPLHSDLTVLYELRALRSLDLDRFYTLRGIENLDLEHLDLFGNRSIFDVDARAELLRLTTLTNLSSLNIGDCKILSDISCLSEMPSLRRLSIHFANERCLLELPSFSALRDLDLSRTYFGRAGWTAVCVCTGLTRLCLQHGNLDSDVHQLSNLVSLQHLDLSCLDERDGIDAAIISLTRCLTQLTSLILAGFHQLTDNGLLHVSRLQHLQHLNVAGSSGLSDEAWRHITTSPSLRSLDMDCCSPSRILPCPSLTNLRLPLVNTPLDLEGFTSLVSLSACRSPFSMLVNLSSLTRLTELSLRYCEASDADLPLLTRLTRLRHINLTGTGVTAAGKRSLRHLGCMQ
jgi:hypothetical protein